MKPRPIHLVLLALAAPMLIAADSSSCGSSGDTGTKVTSSATAAATQTAFKVGDQVKVGDLILVVSGVTSSDGTQFEKSKAGQYLIVAVALQNNGTKAATVSSAISFELRDDGGQTYNETILSTAPKPPDGSIAPGDKLAGSLTYDVPKGKSFKLYFKNAIFGSGQTIIDLGSH